MKNQTRLEKLAKGIEHNLLLTQRRSRYETALDMNTLSEKADEMTCWDCGKITKIRDGSRCDECQAEVDKTTAIGDRIRENLRKMALEREAKAKRKPIATYYSKEQDRRVTVPEED